MAHPAPTVGNPTRQSDLANLIADYDLEHLAASGLHQGRIFPRIIRLPSPMVLTTAPASTLELAGIWNGGYGFGFAAATTEAVNFPWVELDATVNVAAGLTLRCFYQMSSAVAATIVMLTQYSNWRLAATPGNCYQVTSTVAPPSTAVGASLVVALNVASLTNRDLIGLRLQRQAGNANNTHTGAFRFFAAQLEYTWQAPIA